MIFAKILKKDFLRKKIITIVVFAFILLSAALVATGSNLIMELSSSLNALFAQSQAPHFVQMHAGEIEQAKIDEWRKRIDCEYDWGCEICPYQEECYNIKQVLVERERIGK